PAPPGSQRKPPAFPTSSPTPAATWPSPISVTPSCPSARSPTCSASPRRKPSSAPSSAGAGRPPANSAAPPGPGKHPFSSGGQRHALATERSIGAVRHRRPEKRRPPYGSCASACRVVNATRWPPDGASVQSAIGGREKRRPPYGSCASACRVVNATRWPPGGASVQTAIGGRKNADRPTNHRHQRAQWAPMTDFHPACCAPLREHWPLPFPMPGPTLVSTLFQADRLQPDNFVACAIPAVPGASKRQCEYLAGRLCARHALHRLTGQADVPAVGEDRAPHWPAGVVGSITHSQGQAAALGAST